jgi:nucleoside-diphosphate-sugar epimerase
MTRVLLTGASGYLGGRIARELGGDPIHWRGDLRDPDPFAAVDPREVGGIIHAAAVTRFDAPRELAHAVNVAGTQRVIDFARRCPNLARFTYLSSLYASGFTAGPLREAPVTATGFANEYERSKHNAEKLLTDSGLRPQLVRVATVLADDATGAVVQHNVIHRMLRLFHDGLLPIVPGSPETPIYLVTGDLVAREVVRLHREAPAGGVHHLSPTRAAAPTLVELVDRAHAAFSLTPAFRARRVLKPLFTDEPTFAYLADSASHFTTSELGVVIAVVRPFARQLYVTKDVEVAGPLDWPDTGALIDATCAWLARHWGGAA